MSAKFICLSCCKEKPRSPRLCGRQCYCGEEACQRVRKAAWQKQRMRDDPDYRMNQRRCDDAWRRTHPGYWSEYRQKNPEKAERNRLLQRQRNRRRRRGGCTLEADDAMIAKMDAISDKIPKSQVNGDFWLVPVIAKMDAIKVKISAISNGWP